MEGAGHLSGALRLLQEAVRMVNDRGSKTLSAEARDRTSMSLSDVIS